MLKLTILALALTGLPLAAQATGPGVTDREIVIGTTMAYSGPASAYGNFGKIETACLRMINARGGVHGRAVRQARPISIRSGRCDWNASTANPSTFSASP